MGAFGLMLAAAQACAAETYTVGPGRRYSKVSQVAARLKAGDTVEVAGDIEDSFILSRSGTEEKPITIRGIAGSGGATAGGRPQIRIRAGSPCGILCRGDWNVIEGLDISGAINIKTFQAASAIYSEAEHLVVRNCRIHHNKQGIYGDSYRSGSTTIEFCEFDSNGGVSIEHSNLHSVYLCSRKAGATATVENCYFHDAVGGTFLKSRCSRNVIRYNWFENAYAACVYIVDTYQSKTLPQGLYPMHSDIVSNVFFQGWSPGPRYTLLTLGGESEISPGTEGDFNIAHNLFVVTRRRSSSCMHINGNVDRVTAYNNIFMDYGVHNWEVCDRGSVWDVPKTRDFIERRASGEPLIAGVNNWVSTKADETPKGFAATLHGLNPGFADLANCDFRPRAESPLAAKALAPLPRGRVVDLPPEFEPQRGIPSDLRPRPRRKTEHPAIGPFEVAK